MKTTLSLTLTLALASSLTASAQDGQATMGTSSWKCNFSYIGELIDHSANVTLPIAQEMVDNGDLITWGLMTHLFGDEWNVVFYTATPDSDSFIDTATALQTANFAAMSDEETAVFLENCTEHKDSIYSWTFGTTGGEPGDDPTIALSHWKCNFGSMGAIADLMETNVLPIGQSMVDDNDLFVYGMMMHSWGDEWNLMFYSAAQSGSDIVDAVQELNGRTLEAVGQEGFQLLVDSCTEHRDNIYSMPVFTQPRSD